MGSDNFCHIIKANPWLWGNFWYLSLEQSGNKKKKKRTHQWANVPKSISVNRYQRGRGGRGEGGDKGGTTTDSLSLLTPTHLLSHWPTRLSPHPGVQRGSANSFLVLFHWSILTHSGERIKRRVPRRIRTPPFTAFSKAAMKAWKYENALHRGLWRRQFPSCPCLFPM